MAGGPRRSRSRISSSAVRLVDGSSAGSSPGKLMRRRCQNSGWISTGRRVDRASGHPLHPGDVIPVPVAEHDGLDVPGGESSRRMFSTTPFGETPVSNSSVRSRPAFWTRTSAEKPGSPISTSGTSATANRAGTRAAESASALGQLSRVTRPWSQNQRIGDVVHQDRHANPFDRLEPIWAIRDSSPAGLPILRGAQPRQRQGRRNLLQNENEPAEPARSKKNRRRPTLPGGCPPSTIGAGGLNFSVRNGKRCNPAAITAETWCSRA